MPLSLRSRRGLLSTLLTLAAGTAHADRAEHFDTDAAGWTSIDLSTGSGSSAAYTSVGSSNPLTYHPAGGNPGGYISAADPSDQSFYFQAPQAFLGNLSAYAGGTLSFDTGYTPHDNEWRGDPDVVLSDGTTTLFYLGTTNPGADWTSVSVTLAPGTGWSKGSFGGSAPSAGDFATVLASVTLLRIRGEYYTGVAETTKLDNVTLTAVPEPGTWALLGAGLALMGRVRGRRQR